MANKEPYILLTEYQNLYKFKYNKTPQINKYREKWAMQDVIDSVGFDRAYEILKYYFKTSKSFKIGVFGEAVYSTQSFFSNYQATILSAPACFTKQTGEAHWSVLQRARAIENGAFMISAAQAGLHEDGRETYGHSIIVDPRAETKRARAMWGMSRAQVANLVKGVTTGYEKKLEINGVGYREAMQGKNLELALGFSHDVVSEPPVGITIAVPKPTEIIVSGINKQQVGETAANLRKLRKPEPYKGKGIRYAGEQILRKAGKAGKVGGAA